MELRQWWAGCAVRLRHRRGAARLVRWSGCDAPVRERLLRVGMEARHGPPGGRRRRHRITTTGGSGADLAGDVCAFAAASALSDVPLTWKLAFCALRVVPGGGVVGHAGLSVGWDDARPAVGDHCSARRYIVRPMYPPAVPPARASEAVSVRTLPCSDNASRTACTSGSSRRSRPASCGTVARSSIRTASSTSSWVTLKS